MKNTSCFRFVMLGMVLTGVWFPDKIKNKYYKILYVVYAVLYQGVCFFGIVLIEILRLLEVLGDIEKTAQVSLLLLTHLAQFAKIVTIWGRQSRIKHLLHTLESPAFNREESEKKFILDKTTKLASLVCNTYSSLVFVTAAMFGAFPMFQADFYVPLAYPTFSTSSPMYYTVYGYQLFSIIVNAFGNTGMDNLIGGLTGLASAQLDLLSHELTRVGDGSEDPAGSLGYSIECNKRAVHCLKYHQKIIRFVEEIESIFGVAVFCQFASSCIIACMTAFRMTITNEPTQIINLVFYLLTILIELLVYCYFGDVLINKSQQVAEAVYASSWQQTSLKTQRSLMLLMLRAQRPLSITAGKQFNLSLETFVVILKSSYSYFAVLNNNGAE
uniref:Odorant receptor n=1 Tax=Plutella xylostella TaxID=51655 RepID=A0A8G1LU36_PLUXY|nr:odorant receptor 27 [Plutella xylostella]